MNNFKQKFTSYLRGRNFSSALLVTIVIAAVVFVNIIAYTLTNFFGLYLYSAPKDDLSISEAGASLFADDIAAGKKVNVIFCMYEDELKNHDTGAFVLETAREFEKKYPDFIDINFVNVITMLDSDGKPFDIEPYRTVKNSVTGEETETKILSTSVIFEYKVEDEKEVVKHNYRVVTDVYTSAGFADFFTLDESLSATSYNGEEIFATMVNWVLTDYHGTAYMTVGHGETADLTLYNTLACAGYYVKELNLKSGAVPEDAELVVISNPKNDFERSSDANLVTEISRLQSYADRGGKFYVTVDPYSNPLPVLEAFIGEFGISIETAEDGERPVVKDSGNAITTDGFTLVADQADSETATSMLVASGTEAGGVVVRDAAPIVLTGAAEPLLISSSSSVIQAGGATLDSAGSYVIAACSTKVKDGNEAKMFFIPCVYLTSSDAMITDGYSNKDFLYSLFGEFFECGDMPYGCRSIIYDDQVLENLTMGTARLYTAVAIAIPVAIACVGAVVLIRRKNR